MSSTHDHSHNHHAPASFNQAFAIGVVLNLLFVVVEAFYGWRINSLALLADAGHNLSDVASLGLAWSGALAARWRPNARYTYGWKRASILAAFFNAVLLLVAMGSLVWEALHRMGSPEAMDGVTVMAVATVGIVINTATALLFVRGGEHDLNIRGAFVHMAADALVSLGVVVAGALYLWQGWSWIDPVMSLLIAAVIVIGTWGLLRQSLHLLFDGVPDHIHLADVHAYLSSLPEVSEVSDLHVWAMGTTQVALTAHVVTPKGHPGDAFLAEISHQLHDRFEITHVTVQVLTTSAGPVCQPGTTH